jgi:hypothetical protein
LDRENEPGASRPRASSRLGDSARAVGRVARRVGRFWARHRIAGVVLVALIVLAGGAVVDLLRLRADLDAGREAISDLQLDDLDAGLVPTIDEAAAHLRSAERIADGSPFLSVLGAVPGLSTQVDAIRDMTDVADELGRTAVDTSLRIDEVVERAGGDPSQRVRLLDTVLEELDRVEQVVRDVDVGAEGTLVGPLADVRSELVDELDGAPSRLGEARFYVEGLRRLLVGPSRYLVLAANNAEMRGGAGMPLSAGVVTIADGDIEFGAFQQLAYLRFGSPPVTFPESWRATYFRWGFGRSFPETSVSPNFAITGPMYQDMARAVGFGEVDGVLEVDAVALRHLLRVVGPVELDGVRYDETNIEQQILNTNYLRFDELDERGERVEVQAALAQRIFEAFKERDVPVVDLALALRDAAQGRHLLAQSDDPAVQDLWESVGADGRLEVLDLMVTVQNVAANKMDWFIEPEVILNVLPALDGSWKGRLTVEVHNPDPPPEQLSPYVDGSYDGDNGGRHRAMVAVYLPRGAYGVRTLDEPFSEEGYDPPLYMAAKRIDIPRGESVRVALEFSLPAEYYGAQILPSGRVRPVPFRVNGIPLTDAVPTPVLWIQPPGQDETPGAAAVAGALSLAGALAVLAGVRTRLRYAAMRPLRPVPELALRALPFAFVLFLAAAGAIVAGWLISGAQ